MNERPKSFEQVGREMWGDLGKTLAGILFLLGLVWIGVRSAWLGSILMVAVWFLSGLAALALVVAGIAMIWAAVAPIGRCLAPFLPVRVWLTWGPPGGGPWWESLAEAADFVADSSESDAQDNPGEGLVKVRFSSTELKGLWLPGRQAEREDWGIKCIVIQRRQLDQEWNGW